MIKLNDQQTWGDFDAPDGSPAVRSDKSKMYSYGKPIAFPTKRECAKKLKLRHQNVVSQPKRRAVKSEK